MLDVASRLPQLGGNLIERIALYKVQSKGLALILRKGFQYLLEAPVSEPRVD